MQRSLLSRRHVLAASTAWTAGHLAGCAAPGAAQAPATTEPLPPASPSVAGAGPVTPPASLFVQGIPPVPRALVEAVERYSEFRGHGFVDWHPLRREMLVAHRALGDSTTQLYRLGGPQAALERLTHERDPVTSGSYGPRDGRYVVFARARGGDEAFQLYRLDLDTRQVTSLTDAGERHAFQGWIGASGQMLVVSLPLDRTASGGTRAQVQSTLSALDPMQPQVRRVVATLPGGGWGVLDVHPAGTQALLQQYLAATESHVWLIDLADGRRQRLLPRDASAPRASWRHARFSADGSAVVFSSDVEGEFRQPYRLTLATGRTEPLGGPLAWGVDGLTLDRDRTRAALRSNEDGRDVLRLLDLRAGGGALRPGWTEGPVGTVSGAEFHPRRAELAFTIATAQGPAQVYSLDLETGALQAWTKPAAHPQVDPSRFTPQALVRWKSFDGRMISGWLTRPPSRFSGPRPVLVDIHGGPEGQARAGFLGRSQYLVQELGLALIRPNVRGSSGYGKTFLDLDNGLRREDSVRDIGALLDWIATQPDLDARRVVVSGGSYGGYMSLASAVHFANRLAGAIDVVGISHFVTFLESTESYRRDLRRAEYGDERDPAMREFLHRISPLTSAHRITCPLLVVQGRNDPRVPWTEAEQIVARVRAAGTTVWYLRAENEGHGFARKENADYQFWTQVMFLRQVMRL